MEETSRTGSELGAARERWLADIQAPVCRRGAGLWCEAAGNQVLPRREQMGPRHLKEVLNSVALMEYRAPEAVIIRFHGERLHAMLGEAITGLNIIELVEPRFRPVRIARYKSIVELPCGMRYVAPAVLTSGAPAVIETVVLPIEAQPMQLLVVSQEIEELDLWPGDRLSAFDGIRKVFDKVDFLNLGNGIPDPDPGLALMPAV